jgi:hypothetical protein
LIFTSFFLALGAIWLMAVAIGGSDVLHLVVGISWLVIAAGHFASAVIRQRRRRLQG